MNQFREETMNIGELVVDFNINPREFNSETVAEFADVMTTYKESALTFDESWNQRPECTEDKIVTKGSHSLLAALKVYGDQHQITVRVHVGVKGTDKAAFLSAISNVHGKPYKTGERRKCVYQVLQQTRNLKNDNESGKDKYLSLREIAAITGITRGYVYELRRDFRAENGLPNDSGEIFTIEELAEKRAKEQGKTTTAPMDENTQETPEEPQKLTKEEAADMDPEELVERLRKEKGIDGEEGDDASDAAKGDPLEQPVSEPAEVSEPADEEEDDVYYDEDGDEAAVEEQLANIPPDAELPEGVTMGKEMGDSDVEDNNTESTALAKKTLEDQINKERNSLVKDVKELMDDFLKLTKHESSEALQLYGGELDVIRNDPSLWDPDVDPELNARDIVHSLITKFIERLELEYEQYAETLEELNSEQE